MPKRQFVLVCHSSRSRKISKGRHVFTGKIPSQAAKKACSMVAKISKSKGIFHAILREVNTKKLYYYQCQRKNLRKHIKVVIKGKEIVYKHKTVAKRFPVPTKKPRWCTKKSWDQVGGVYRTIDIEVHKNSNDKIKIDNSKGETTGSLTDGSIFFNAPLGGIGMKFNKDKLLHIGNGQIKLNSTNTLDNSLGLVH